LSAGGLITIAPNYAGRFPARALFRERAPGPHRPWGPPASYGSRHSMPIPGGRALPGGRFPQPVPACCGIPTPHRRAITRLTGCICCLQPAFDLHHSHSLPFRTPTHIFRVSMCLSHCGSDAVPSLVDRAGKIVRLRRFLPAFNRAPAWAPMGPNVCCAIVRAPSCDCLPYHSWAWPRATTPPTTISGHIYINILGGGGVCLTTAKPLSHSGVGNRPFGGGEQAEMTTLTPDPSTVGVAIPFSVFGSVNLSRPWAFSNGMCWHLPTISLFSLFLDGGVAINFCRRCSIYPLVPIPGRQPSQAGPGGGRQAPAPAGAGGQPSARVPFIGPRTPVPWADYLLTRPTYQAGRSGPFVEPASLPATLPVTTNLHSGRWDIPCRTVFGDEDPVGIALLLAGHSLLPGT